MAAGRPYAMDRRGCMPDGSYHLPQTSVGGVRRRLSVKRIVSAASNRRSAAAHRDAARRIARRAGACHP